MNKFCYKKESPGHPLNSSEYNVVHSYRKYIIVGLTLPYVQYTNLEILFPMNCCWWFVIWTFLGSENVISTIIESIKINRTALLILIWYSWINVVIG